MTLAIKSHQPSTRCVAEKSNNMTSSKRPRELWPRQTRHLTCNVNVIID